MTVTTLDPDIGPEFQCNVPNRIRWKFPSPRALQDRRLSHLFEEFEEVFDEVFVL